MKPLDRRGLIRAAMVTLAVATSTAITTATNAIAGPMQGSPHLVRFGAAARLPQGAVETAPLPPRSALEFGIALRPRDAAGLAHLAQSISTTGTVGYHDFVDPTFVAKHFGPTATAIAAVTRYLLSAGLRVGHAGANQLLLPVSGTVKAISRVFGTSIVGVRFRGGGRGWRATAAPLLPAELAPSVTGVVGLDDLTSQAALPRPVAASSGLVPRAVSQSGATPAASVVSAAPMTGAPSACRGAKSAAAGAAGWTDDQIAQAYGLSGLFAKGDLAAGQTIAVFELEPFATSDLAAFDRCYFGTSRAAQVSRLPIDGFGLTGPGSGESILDIENLAAFAPDAKILDYEAPNTTFGSLDAYEAMVSEDRANIITTSWGECESTVDAGAPGAQQLENYLFEEAAAQGQTVVASSGDTGSDDCATTPFTSSAAVAPYLSVDDPASQPYVLGVGGTSLQSVVQPLGASAETVWNDGPGGGASGGGVSLSWQSPVWQAGSGVPGVATTGGRQVPDVSASADEQHGTTVYSKVFPHGGWTTIGGTSSSAPFWAAVLAEIADSGPTGTSCGALPLTAGGADLGFVTPELYAVASLAYPTTFHQVTSGDNDMFNKGLGYQATAGFNLAAGLGSPIVTTAGGGPGLAAALCSEATSSASGEPPRPVITSLSPPSGPTGGGTPITINLSAPLAPGVTARVQVGASPAAVTTTSGASITVTSPAAVLTAGSASYAGAGPAEVTVMVSSGTSESASLPGPTSLFDYVNAAASGLPVPTVSGMSPYGGTPSGGNSIVVYGSGFSSGLVSVRFGGVPAPAASVLTDNELRVTVPPRTGSTVCAAGAHFDGTDNCQVEVTATNLNGTSATSPILPAVSGAVIFTPQGIIDPTPGFEVAPASSEYDYAPRPVITRVSPEYAAPSGRSAVTIRGHGFSLDTFQWVNFGPARNPANEEVKIVYISGTEIKIDPPAGPKGGGVLRGGVSVQTIGGLSKIAHFGYAARPTVKGLSVRSGPDGGGTTVTLSGSSLVGVSSILFSSVLPRPAKMRVLITKGLKDDTTSVRFVTPPDLTGSVDVLPCTPAGCASPDPASDRFVYRGA